MLNRTLTFLLIACLISVSANAGWANERDRDVRVVTYNMYLGTDFTEIFSAQSLPEVLSEVAEAYGDVQSGNPEERIEAIADQIAASNAVVVGFQEVALWRTGTIFDPSPATNVSYDFLRILLNELDGRGLHYEAVSVQTNFDAELPGAGNAIVADVRYTDRDVVLVRSGLSTSEVKVENSQSNTFENLLTLPTIIGNVTVQRGWNSVDVKLRGKTYRFINAHTEAYHPLVQYAQTAELLQGPANTALPVIIVGDFNSDAETGGASYQLILGAGYADVWEITHPIDSGFTWPLFLTSPDIFTMPSERLDLVMVRGAVDIKDSDVIGENAVTDLTASGSRPSDHAGVSATITVQP